MYCNICGEEFGVIIHFCEFDDCGVCEQCAEDGNIDDRCQECPYKNECDTYRIFFT